MSKLKSKIVFFCTECGYESSGYLGKCSACGAWGTFKEASFVKSSKKQEREQSLFLQSEESLLQLKDIPSSDIQRYLTGSQEFDRVLGAGLVPGALVLLGGEPGIGKSTLLLQVANSMTAAKRKVIYISAEESSRQLKLRAQRLNVNEEILVFASCNLDEILAILEREKADLVIVDSIQAIYSSSLDSLPGSPSQIKESCSRLMRLAKLVNTSMIIVGHINKDGDLAGPKILEHMVDTVLQFEGSKDSNIRFLRALKNRFGSTDELGIFEISSEGLGDLSNPSELFLAERSGGVLTATRDGRRTIVIEIQALVLNSEYNNPRRMANGIELSRLHQILAVLEKETRIALSKADVYINIVGGLSVSEPAIDLAIALAIYNSAMNHSNDEAWVALGELGLNGELRSVRDLDQRIKECQKLGFNNLIIPYGNKITNNQALKLRSIKNLGDLLVV